MNKKEAREVYDRIVENNISNRLKDYQDPDIPYEDAIIIKNLNGIMPEKCGLECHRTACAVLKKCSQYVWKMQIYFLRNMIC